MLKILLFGYNGQMGQVIRGLVKDMDDVIIAAGVDAFISEGADCPVYTSIDDCEEEVDVIIDFSVAAAVDSVFAYAKERKIPLVECTTGLSQEQLDELDRLSGDIPVLRSANMSLGVNTLLKLVKAAAGILARAGFDIDIVEKHHRRKMDAPSGTALALADAVNDACQGRFDYVYDRSERRMKRPAEEIGISAVRGGTIVGEHEVIFAGTDEVIELKHTAYSRAIFGKGALAAAAFLAGKPAGMYGMSDVIDG